MYDIVIVGGGPAGLTAALYALRAGKTVLVIEKASFGGQITFSPKVENIPGFLALSGNEFAEKLVEQVIEQGGEFESAEVTGLENLPDGSWKVLSDDGDFEAKAVIVATGAKHRMLGVPGEEELVGNGISFCAVCDGAFYKDQTVAVIGGGNSALVEAVLLAELVKKLYIVQNLDYLTAEAKLQQQLLANDNVEVIYGVTVDSFLGEGELKGIRIKNEHDGSMRELALDGLFIAIGLIPQNEPFAAQIPLNAWGYADSDESCTTPAKGLFVAGDCRSKRIRQVTTAAADGAIAALAAADYIDKMK